MDNQREKGERSSIMTSLRALLIMTLAGVSAVGMVNRAEASWAPTTATQLTRWGKQVTPDNAWRVYTRPQLVRENWHSLNGMWNLAIDGNAVAETPVFDHEILVPYPVEASLSGVGKRATHLMYKRN